MIPILLESIWDNFAITRMAFFIFIAGAALLYYICPQKIRCGVFLFSSVIFIWLASDGYRGILYIAVGGLLSWIAGISLQSARSSRIKALILLIFITLVFGAFVWFRCMDFFWETGRHFGEIFNIHIGSGEINIIAPIGISYWSLTLIAYVTDVYRGVIAPEKNPLKILIFVTYFPQLICGPITRYKDMHDELFVGHTFSYENITFGVQRIVWGMFKKIVIADRISAFVNTVYGDPASWPGYYVLVAILFFGIQIFCDFSGCIDIIIGASQIFGVRLPENFNVPFFSKTVQEFYQRWHITLGLWGKDYIMYPILKWSGTQAVSNAIKKSLGKKKGKIVAKKVTLYLGLLACWMIIGFWHGGSYKFLISTGLIPALMMIVGDLTADFFKKVSDALHIKTESFWWKLFQHLRTIFFIYAGVWTLFAASSVKNGIEIIKALWPLNNPEVLFHAKSFFSLGLDARDMVLIIVGTALVFSVEIIHHKGIRIREWISKKPLLFRWLIYLVAFFSVIIFGMYGPGYDPANFIYRG